MTLIKNCGLRTLGDMQIAADTGAAFIGLVHHAASPRHLTLEEMAALAQQAPAGIKKVAVLVNPNDALLARLVTDVAPDYLQLHKVDAARAAEVGSRFALPLILGVAMRHADDVALAHTLEPHAAHLLLDAPESGSGQAFDWAMLQGVQFAKPWFLAGGLHAGNVAEAIRTSGAPMVDVSSGIEHAPGQKSPEKIAAFNRAVLATSH